MLHHTSLKVSPLSRADTTIGNAQAGCSNEAVDLKKEEIEQLIVQLILDRVLVCVSPFSNLMLVDKSLLLDSLFVFMVMLNVYLYVKTS